jgi:anti-sigma factor RsiW
MKVTGRHPGRETLALHAGGDLGRFQAWRTARHLERCTECREEVAAFEEMREALPQLNEMPEVRWDRIGAEMSANIRLGLAAGECVREASEPRGRYPLFMGARTAIALASLCAVVAAALVLQHPTPPVMSAGIPIAQITQDGIQTRAGNQGFALIHTNAHGVTHTVGAEGTMGASYVDPSTGYVTMTKVYAE